MREHRTRQGLLRTRWSAIGAAVAVTLGAGGLSMAQAAIDDGDRPVTVSIGAERILDTRTSLGLAGRFADATPRDLQVTGSVAVASGPDKTVVPDDAIGVLVNVTVVTPTHDGFLSLRPEGATGEPTTSTVNFTPGSIEPNAATVDLNDGKIQIWVETSSDAGSADVLVDIVGYTIGHTHDDRYYTETESDAAVAAAVAPKANSADVYTKDDVIDLLAARQVLVGGSNSDGSKAGTGPFTVTRTGVGVYSVAYSGLAPLRIAYPGTSPTITVTPHTSCADGAVASARMTSWGGSGAILFSMNFVVETHSSAGAATDCRTQFTAHFAGPDVPPAFPAQTRSLNTGSATECMSTPEETVCS